MNTKHTRYLYETYPKLYRQHTLPMSETSMYWGFDHGDGWFKIINALSRVLTILDVEHHTKTEAVQVKEKFGTLRFYIEGGTELHYQAIKKAEDLSAETCEDCGKPGKLRGVAWLVTLCDKCYKNRDK